MALKLQKAKLKHEMQKTKNNWIELLHFSATVEQNMMELFHDLLP